MIYFDSAATTFQKPPSVYRAVQRGMHTCASVGRGGHWAAMNAAKTVYDCRSLAAKLFDCEEEQVCFTMNATHGLNIAIRSLVPEGAAVAISGFEHNAVTRPLHALGTKNYVFGSRLFSPELALEELETALRHRPAAVICTHVSNVFGYILPLQEIAELCRQRSVPLIVDCSQSAGTLPISLRQIGADFLCMPGHKGLYGPQGTGLLICREGAEPLLFGGTGSASLEQEMPSFLPDRVEAGTHNVCGIAGLSAGLRYVLSRTPERILRHEKQLMSALKQKLTGIPQLKPFFGEMQTGVVSVVGRTIDSEELAQQLSKNGVAVRAGLHCAPLAHKTARTLETGTVRISFSDFNTVHEVAQFAALCKNLPIQQENLL